MCNNIENKENTENKLKGTSIKIREILRKPIIVINCYKNKSIKEDCNHYYSFNFIMNGISNGKKTKLAFYTRTGAKDITTFFDKVNSGEIKLPLPLKVYEEGKSLFFDGYRYYNEEVANQLIDEYQIDSSLLDALDEDNE